MGKPMKFVLYEDKRCYYIWKPAGFPSTFGKEKSFLDYLLEEKNTSFLSEFMKNQLENFTREEECGLLNRLDNATTGLLYFAKSPAIKEKYKHLQQEGKLKKYYLLEVYGNINYWLQEKGAYIDYPIAHHKFEKDRMVVLLSDSDKLKSETRLHYVKTQILEHERSSATNTSFVIVVIQKGIRHQIRSHFSSIGYPIVGDPLYGKKKDPKKGKLQLFSIGLSLSE